MNQYKTSDAELLAMGFSLLDRDFYESMRDSACLDRVNKSDSTELATFTGINF
jgi:hypothetical protein